MPLLESEYIPVEDLIYSPSEPTKTKVKKFPKNKPKKEQTSKELPEELPKKTKSKKTSKKSQEATAVVQEPPETTAVVQKSSKEPKPKSTRKPHPLKGSQEMKDKMAKLRAMRKSKPKSEEPKDKPKIL